MRVGVPFREAHAIVGRVVARATESGSTLSQFPLGELREISPQFGADVAGVFDMDASLARRNAPGGTAPVAVAAQIEAAREWLERFDKDGGTG